MAQIKSMRVVVTIPAYNEEGTIGGVISQVNEVMKKTRHSYRVIVVDDGSKDDTAAVARKAGASVSQHPYNYGLAEVFRTEMKEALGLKPDVIVHIDADGQYRAEEIPKLLEPIERGEADLVLGSRFMGTIESMPFMKRLGNRMFSRVISGITRVRITDGQTGFRAFTRRFAESIEIKSRHTYTQEMIIRAIREKFRIKEVPVYFAKRSSGKSRLMSGPLEYAIKAWINIFRIYRDYEPLKFFGSLGVFFLAIGGIIGLYILYLLFTFGVAGVIDRSVPTVLLSVLFIVSGVQLLSFGFLADKNVQ